MGTPKDMLSKALEWASVSVGAPLLGNMERRFFLRAFEIKRHIKVAKPLFRLTEVGLLLP
jgi:hypothetical protein